LGFATIAIFLFAIMTKRVSVLVALILIPTTAGLVAVAGAGLGTVMLEGINRVAPVGVMIIFAVLYFGLMLDVGLFEPMIRRLLRFVKGDPPQGRARYCRAHHGRLTRWRRCHHVPYHNFCHATALPAAWHESACALRHCRSRRGCHEHHSMGRTYRARHGRA